MIAVAGYDLVVGGLLFAICAVLLTVDAGRDGRRR